MRLSPGETTPRIGSITHVLGARPNFVKAAPVIRALAGLGAAQRVVHTGQHYDERMSDVFFVQLGLPRPDVNLGVGSGTQARQTAEVMVGMEREFTENSPAIAVVYGDVNSTIGAALAGVKLGVPLAHVEAGLRSFDDTMPEEINRRLTDQLCSLLFVTSPEAIGHLAREGRPVDAVHFVGNPMIDTLLANLDKFDDVAARRAHGLGERRYVVATLHRPSNVDDITRARGLVRALHEVAAALRSPKPGCSTPPGSGWWTRSATSSSCRWFAAPRRSSPIRAACRRRLRCCACLASRSGRTPSGRSPSPAAATGSSPPMSWPPRCSRRATTVRTPGSCRRCGTGRPGRGSPGSSPAGSRHDGHATRRSGRDRLRSGLRRVRGRWRARGRGRGRRP